MLDEPVRFLISESCPCQYAVSVGILVCRFVPATTSASYGGLALGADVEEQRKLGP